MDDLLTEILVYLFLFKNDVKSPDCVASNDGVINEF
jgi:hypothetical protein